MQAWPGRGYLLHYTSTRLECPVLGSAWLAPAVACHVTIQARCLRPAARDRSIMWELAYAGPGCDLKPQTTGSRREEHVSVIRCCGWSSKSHWHRSFSPTVQVLVCVAVLRKQQPTMGRVCKTGWVKWQIEQRLNPVYGEWLRITYWWQIITTMSVLVILGRKWMLAASCAAPWWVSTVLHALLKLEKRTGHSIKVGKNGGKTDVYQTITLHLLLDATGIMKGVKMSDDKQLIFNKITMQIVQITYNAVGGDKIFMITL